MFISGVVQDSRLHCRLGTSRAGGPTASRRALATASETPMIAFAPHFALLWRPVAVEEAAVQSRN